MYDSRWVCGQGISLTEMRTSDVVKATVIIHVLSVWMMRGSPWKQTADTSSVVNSFYVLLSMHTCTCRSIFVLCFFLLSLLIYSYNPIADARYTLLLLVTKFSERVFSHAVPTAWNSLPHELRAAPTLNSFKCRPKTHLFNTAFNR